MKKLFFIFITSLLCVNSTAQKHEIGVFLGGTNFISDIGRADYINPFPESFDRKYLLPIAGGIIYRLNYNPQHTIRFSLGYFKESGNDEEAVEDYRQNRLLQYKNSLIEASTVFEYNFFPINSEQQYAFSPYIFGGIAGYYTNTPKANVYHQFARDENGFVLNPNNNDFESHIDFETTKSLGFSIPFGVGLKYKFGWNWVVSGEVGFRPTFNDDLDLGTPRENNYDFYIEKDLLDYYSEEIIQERNKEIKNNTTIGNPSTNDWYVFSGLTLTYTFGRPPCFCD